MISVKFMLKDFNNFINQQLEIFFFIIKLILIINDLQTRKENEKL